MTCVIRFTLIGLVVLMFASAANAAVPLLITHEGMIMIGSKPANGDGFCKFGFFANGVWLWTNDGSHLGEAVSTPPDAAVTVTFDKGAYEVVLGDTSIPNMIALTSAALDADAVWFRIFFDDGQHGEQLLQPDERVTASAYAFKADSADLLDGQDGLFYQDATNITAGILSADRFSAYGDLSDEGKIGSGAGQLAPGNHPHYLQDLLGAVTDLQVPDDITIGYAATAGDADTLDGQHGSFYQNASNMTTGILADGRFSAFEDLAAEFKIGTAPDQLAQGSHLHNLQDLPGAVTDAQVPDDITVSNADTIDGLHAADLTAAGGIPAGVIVMWSGAVAAIPSGWLLCDGTNSTPDLRDRFIVGASPSYTPGSTGGTATHSHSGALGGANDRRWVDDNSGGDDHYVSGENHQHTFSTDAAGSLPPYYALAFIIKE